MQIIFWPFFPSEPFKFRWKAQSLVIEHSLTHGVTALVTIQLIID